MNSASTRAFDPGDECAKYIAIVVEHDEVRVASGSEYSFIIATHDSSRVPAGGADGRGQIPFREAREVADGKIHG